MLQEKLNLLLVLTGTFLLSAIVLTVTKIKTSKLRKKSSELLKHITETTDIDIDYSDLDKVYTTIRNKEEQLYILASKPIRLDGKLDLQKVSLIITELHSLEEVKRYLESSKCKKVSCTIHTDLDICIKDNFTCREDSTKLAVKLQNILNE